MGKIMNSDIEKTNKELKDKSPEEIIKWAIQIAKNPVITTNFRPYEVAILNAVTAVKTDFNIEFKHSFIHTKTNSCI